MNNLSDLPENNKPTPAELRREESKGQSGDYIYAQTARSIETDGTQAPLLFGEALLEKVALPVPKASASSAGHLVGKPAGRGQCAEFGILHCRWKVGP